MKPKNLSPDLKLMQQKRIEKFASTSTRRAQLAPKNSPQGPTRRDANLPRGYF